MRIAYVLTSLGMGGAERQVIALAERMKARGHAVSLLVLMGQRPQEWPTTLDVVRLGMRKNPASVIAGLIRARRFLRGFQPDLIHSHVFPANMAARLLRILLPATKVLSTVHNVYEGAWPRMLAYRLTDFLSRRTVAVSTAAAERYVRLKAIPAHKASVLTNGIDTVEFAPHPERRAQMRMEMVVGDEFIWLAAGRITPAKDYPNLLCAFALVRAAIPEARLWIAGEAGAELLTGKLNLNDKKCVETLILKGKKCQGTSSASEVSEIGSLPRLSKRGFWPLLVAKNLLLRGKKCQGTTLVVPQILHNKKWALAPAGCSSEIHPSESSSVLWLGLRRDMPALLDAADGFVLASAWEGMPLVVAEAMAMVKPVVATDVGGVRELVGEAGLIVPAKSSESLAAAMLELMRKPPEARRALGRAAREGIVAHFSIDAKVAEWEALYRAV